MKIFYKDALWSPLGCQSMETMDPKKLEFPQEPMLGKERDEGWCQLGGGGEGCLLDTVLTVRQITIQERLELRPR